MKPILRFSLLLLSPLFIQASFAQRVKISGALGGSAYYGDLVQGAPLLKQVSPALTLGGSYDFGEKIRGRLNISFLGIKGDDADNKDIKYQERNLNFKSFIWEVSTAVEYDFLNTVEEYSFTPYIFAGPGLFHFNPYTTDRFGNKQFLQQWGTEGQGLASYPDRKPYSLTQINLGFGGGVRYDLNDALSIGAEVFIRKTFTDYLDDVSQNDYVAPATFAAEGNAYSALLSYRGDEYPVGKAFRGTSMPRGNPDSKDLFYTFQLKFTYKLNVDWGGSLGFYSGGGRSGGGGYGPRGKVRNPRSVL
jgi:hypothetical protein